MRITFPDSIHPSRRLPTLKSDARRALRQSGVAAASCGPVLFFLHLPSPAKVP